jgi:peptidoglycan/xylan/chitin deacetylase (PgdA/CDA1 family)
MRTILVNPRSLLAAAQRVVPRAQGGISVLAYHLVGAGTTSPVDLDVEVFTEQLSFLRAECEVLSLSDALAGVPTSKRRGGRPSVVLTFDDAYANFASVVLPLLVRFALPATLYVPVGFIQGSAPCPIRRTSLPPCTWDELKQLSTAGIEVGSHSMRHVNLARATADEVDRELKESRAILEDRLGVAVTSFCYPQAKWSAFVAQRARAYYSSAVIAGGRRMSFRTDRARIPRFPVRRDLKDFPAMVRSRMWLPEVAADTVRQWIA